MAETKSDGRPLPAKGRLYVASIVCAGVAVVLHSFTEIQLRDLDLGYFALALLTLISGSFTVKIPGATSTISVSETFVIVAAVTYGPGPAAILVATEGLVVSLWILKRSNEVYRVFFNMATGAVSVWASANLFFLLATQPLSLDTPASVLQLIVPLLVFATAYFLINSWLIATAIALDTKQSPLHVWKTSFLFLSLNYITGASLAMLLLPYMANLGPTSVLLVAPLMVLAYVTFHTAMGRIADANAHLTEVNRLYLSTIETLAMAIDAKDQITHGHVRRVQAYASGLARQVGMTSERDLKALAAASLLHDMGKLAIPEHILNKPGKLTKAEFEKMKTHAGIGADILSSINFPYPVVPIVRHHHENWDGNGYPDGLSGENIPLGARILAVVDCFDALTSDRPYRPMLPDEEALQILRERSGNMYDPFLVSTFIRIYKEIAPPSATVVNDKSGALAELSKSLDSSKLERHPASTTPTSQLSDGAKAEDVAAEVALLDGLKPTVTRLKETLPASSIVVFLYNPDQDEIVARYCHGDHKEEFSGLRIPLGQRLSGWVAATHRAVVNSDPALDLCELTQTLAPRPMSCIATPIMAEGALLGVLTIYSTKRDAFSKHDRLLASEAAQEIGGVPKVTTNANRGEVRSG